MLHAASEYNKADLCLLLIQMGVDPDHTDNKGCKALYYNRNREEFGESPVDTARVLATAQDHLATEDISESGVDHRQGLPHRTELLWAMGRSSIKGNDWETFFLRLALRYHGSDGMHWGSLIRKLVGYNADIHARTPERQRSPVQFRYEFRGDVPSYLSSGPEMTFTPLDDLFTHSTDAFEARYFAKDWLSILTEAGYSVHAYLEKERQLHSAQNMLTCPDFYTTGIRPGSTYASRRLIFELGETPNVEWDWWIDPSSSASLVCHEFPIHGFPFSALVLCHFRLGAHGMARDMAV